MTKDSHAFSLFDQAKGTHHFAGFVTKQNNGEDNTTDTSTIDPSKDTQSGNPDDSNKPVHDWAKRYSDLKSHSDKTMNELNKKIEDLTEKLNSSTKTAPAIPKNAEDIAKFKAQYPEFCDYIVSIARMEDQNTTQSISPSKSSNLNLA